jgi:hypothetical protein
MIGSVLSKARWYATHNGGKCLSRSFQIGRDLAWMCERGHTWDADLRLVELGAWCPQCLMHAGPTERLAYYKALALSKGGRCHSTAYRSWAAHMEWECAQGHRWTASPGPIKGRGVWCPHCAHKAPLDLEEMHRTAARSGGKCLAQVYLGNHVKLIWQCEKGHLWEAAPSHIRSGRWCPHRNCRYAKMAAKERGDVDELYAIAKLRGGEYLSKNYKNRSTPVKWRCSEGHTWMAAVSNVKFCGTWCPKCPRVAGAKDAFKKQLKELMVRKRV